MKPLLLKVAYGPFHSFSVRKDVSPYFYNHWHYHPELELTYIHKGTGTRFIGDSIERFEAGDLVLVGSDLPHLWRSDQKYYPDTNTELSEALVVHFKPDFWGTEFLKLPELATIQELFVLARQGLRIRGETQYLVASLVEGLQLAEGVERFLGLIRILQVISESAETYPISSMAFSYSANETDTRRLNNIYTYTLNHFTQKIKLEDVAAIANMSTSAFCRYFKSHTHKTYIKFLQEVRISHACKLLLEDKYSINQICLESGFQDWSNFNRYFKEIKKQTPTQYYQDYVKSKTNFPK
jgi:AraC-like DNA-binding protein